MVMLKNNNMKIEDFCTYSLYFIFSESVFEWISNKKKQVSAFILRIPKFY